jgi:hypothetical protein
MPDHHLAAEIFRWRHPGEVPRGSRQEGAVHLVTRVGTVNVHVAALGNTVLWIIRDGQPSPDAGAVIAVEAVEAAGSQVQQPLAGNQPLRVRLQAAFVLPFLSQRRFQ